MATASAHSDERACPHLSCSSAMCRSLACSCASADTHQRDTEGTQPCRHDTSRESSIPTQNTDTYTIFARTQSLHMLYHTPRPLPGCQSCTCARPSPDASFILVVLCLSLSSAASCLASSVLSLASACEISSDLIDTARDPMHTAHHRMIA